MNNSLSKTSFLASNFWCSYSVPFYASVFFFPLSFFNWMLSTHHGFFPVQSTEAWHRAVLDIPPPSPYWPWVSIVSSLVWPAPSLPFVQWNKDFQAVVSFSDLKPEWIFGTITAFFFFRNSKRGLKFPYKDQSWGMLSHKKDFIQSSSNKHTWETIFLNQLLLYSINNTLL